MTNKIILSFLVLLAAFAAPAHAQQCTNTPEAYRVFFGNGILNSQKNAEYSMAKLEQRLGSTFNSQKISYDLAYNYSDGAFKDLLQSLIQQLGQQSNSQQWLWLYDVGVVPAWFKDFRQNANTSFYQIVSSELTDQVAKYKEAILQGQKVLVVSHSQGNFYVNEAKQILAAAQPAVPMGSFGIFGVASPANNVGGASGPYLTNHIDMITLVPSSLPANWTLKRTTAGTPAEGILSPVAAHSFSGTYMNPNFDIAPALIAGIKNQMGSLQDPPAVAKSGPVTATLTWNSDKADVDLHIFEPNGFHVDWITKQGTSGVLDLDNTQGYGPEHYYTDCNQLQTGEYTFGLNYFEDLITTSNSTPVRPVSAILTISVPGATRTFSITIDDAIGSAGKNAPWRLAKVVVTKVTDSNPNLNGKLKYKIVPL